MSETFEEIVASLGTEEAPVFSYVDQRSKIVRALCGDVVDSRKSYYVRSARYAKLLDGEVVELPFSDESSGWAIIHRSPNAQHCYVEKALAFPTRERRRDPLRRSHQEVRDLFQMYAARWREDTMFESSVTRIISNEAYQRIIGLGLAVVPLVINELRNGPEHWFWALTSIVGENMAEGTQTLEEAAKAWVIWFESVFTEVEW